MKQMIILLGILLSYGSYAADTYSCQVFGEYQNEEGQRYQVNVENLQVEVNGEKLLFGRIDEPEHDFDMRPETAPWTLRLSTERDGGETPLILRLSSPDRSMNGYAYAEPGSKYIGFVLNYSIEALCKKN